MQSAGASTSEFAAAKRRPSVDLGRRAHRRRGAGAPRAIAQFGFGYLAALCDFGAIVLAACASNLIYMAMTFGLASDVEPEIGRAHV